MLISPIQKVRARGKGSATEDGTPSVPAAPASGLPGMEGPTLAPPEPMAAGKAVRKLRSKGVPGAQPAKNPEDEEPTFGT